MHMATPRLPIAGFTHIALSAQDDEGLHAKTIANLRKAGFKIDGDLLVPPEGADSRAIIRSITEAFLEAKAG
jgi:hypothetical protein